MIVVINAVVSHRIHVINAAPRLVEWPKVADKNLTSSALSLSTSNATTYVISHGTHGQSLQDLLRREDTCVGNCSSHRHVLQAKTCLLLAVFGQDVDSG